TKNVGELPIKILVAELVAGQSLADLFEDIYDIVPSPIRLSAAAVVVRPPVQFQLDPNVLIDLIKTKGLAEAPISAYKFLIDALRDPQKAFARMKRTPVHILASNDFDHFLSPVIVNEGRSPVPYSVSELALIEAVREAELDALIEDGRAKLPGAPGVMYRAPSGTYMRAFLRVGNIQRSRSAVDALFFWLLPHLRGCRGIVSDTWSISTVALNVSRRLAEYTGLDLTPVEMLSSYHRESSDRASEAANTIQIAYQQSGIKPEAADSPGLSPNYILILISATHTGSLVRSLRSLLELRLIDRHVRFVALFKMSKGGEEIAVLKDLSKRRNAAEYAAVAPDTEQGDIETIPIDEQVYFPLQYRDYEYHLRAPDSKLTFEFLQQYKGTSLFRAHRDVDDDGVIRHQALWIDTGNLFSQPTFQRKFRTRIRSLDPVPDVIIIPGHDASKELAKLAVAELQLKGINPQVFEHASLNFEDNTKANKKIKAAIEGIPADRGLLILDDAYITGSRLEGYNQSFRDFEFCGRLHYLIGVARPEN